MRSPGRRIWLILALFVAGGAAMTAWEPTREILVGPLWLTGSLATALLYAVMAARAARLERLRRTGEPGTARAVSVRELGLTVHEMPRVELELEVHWPSGARTSTERLVVPLDAVERLREGERLPVKVDPGSGRIAFVWPDTGGPRASLIARALGGPAAIDPAALHVESKFLEGARSPRRPRRLDDVDLESGEAE